MLTVDVAAQIYEDLKQNPPTTARPSSTYRLQLHAGFNFRQAQDIVPYLHRLGITHVYASPCFRAVPGSPHGYDVQDPGELNPELGTTEDFEALVDTLRQHGMGIIIDFVSNHIGIGAGNPYWMDVLEGGQTSAWARMFDIDWAPTRRDLAHRVLLPILGDQYGIVLERGEFKVELEDGAFFLRYFDHKMPLCVNSWGRILEGVAPDLVAAIAALPSYAETDSPRRQLRASLVQSVQKRLSSVQDAVQERLQVLNGSFDALDALIQEQPYRLADWRVAGEEINYRRFFDINNLAAIRMEDAEVFAHMHRLVLAWLETGLVDGLRIDHPDGLYHPAGYFARLQEEFVLRAARRRGCPPEAEEAVLDLWRRDGPQRPAYVVVEKILAAGEHMPSDWAIDGTTGYEFLNALNGLFVDPHHADAMDAIYHRFIRRKTHFRELVYRKKKLIMTDLMASEINMLALRLSRLAHGDRRTRDFTASSLKRALVEFIACSNIYRTYVDGTPDERDRRYIEEAVSRARRRVSGLDPTVFDFLRGVLLVSSDEALVFVMKLQQLTGAIMAKSLEDTCFYLYNRLISLNEVGGQPQRFGHGVWTFHNVNRERAVHWPGALSSTSTHDTKRGEDVRARINVLSDIPELWKYHLGVWNRMHLIHKAEVNGHLAPDRNEEYFLYQTLVGTWPRTLDIDDVYRTRIKDTMRKALREAKRHSSWLHNNVEYENAVLAFVDRVLTGDSAFLADMVPFMRQVTMAGLHNSLSQVLLKAASPGVPDVYQGCELWDDSLVDPDNRRPVDFDRRQRILQDMDGGVSGDRTNLAHGLYRNLRDPLEDGRLKLFVTGGLLRFRRQHADLFRQGRYIPLEAIERWRDHVCAFARQWKDQLVLAVAPLRVYRLLGKDGVMKPELWEETWIPVPGGPEPMRFVEVLTGTVLTSEVYEERAGLRLRDVLGQFPVALLHRL